MTLSKMRLATTSSRRMQQIFPPGVGQIGIGSMQIGPQMFPGGTPPPPPPNPFATMETFTNQTSDGSSILFPIRAAQVQRPPFPFQLPGSVILFISTNDPAPSISDDGGNTFTLIKHQDGYSSGYTEIYLCNLVNPSTQITIQPSGAFALCAAMASVSQQGQLDVAPIDSTCPVGSPPASAESAPLTSAIAQFVWVSICTVGFNENPPNNFAYSGGIDAAWAETVVGWPVVGPTGSEILLWTASNGSGPTTVQAVTGPDTLPSVVFSRVLGNSILSFKAL